MKKLTAFVMAIVLSLSCISEVYALEVTAAAENTEANTEEAGSSEGGTAFEDTDDAPGSQDESYLKNETEESDQMATPNQDISSDANEGETSGETEAPNEETLESETETKTADEEEVLLQDIGQVDVSIAAALVLDREVAFTVTFTDDQGSSQSDEVL